MNYFGIDNLTFYPSFKTDTEEKILLLTSVCVSSDMYKFRNE